MKYGTDRNAEVGKAQAGASKIAQEEERNNGVDFLTAFDAAMTGMGWAYTGDHCICEDPDSGHEPACGWTKISDPDFVERIACAESQIEEQRSRS